MPDHLQALCFLAGANSIFYGDKLLTTPNPAADSDGALFARLGLHSMPSEESTAPSATPARASAGSLTEHIDR
jgi:biotin synthase